MRTARIVALISAFLSGCVEAEKEGDFAIRMPREAQSAPNRETVTLEIRLKADAHGKLSGVFLGGQQLVPDEGDGDVLDSLNRRVREIVQDTDGQALASPDHEAVIRVDGTLDSSFVMDAIQAVSSYTGPDGTVHHLVTRVRFDATGTTSLDPHRTGAN